MNKICIAESHALIGALATNTDWGKINRSSLLKIEDNPVEAGKRFAEFLNSFEEERNVPSRVIQIDRTIAFNPANLLGPQWSIEEQDIDSVSLTEIDLSQVILDNALHDGEDMVRGSTKIHRLRKKKQVLLDIGIFLTLWSDQGLIPEEWKEKTDGDTTFICFDGTILKSPRDVKCIVYLYWKGEWCWRQQSLEDMFDKCTPSAVLPEKVFDSK